MTLYKAKSFLKKYETKIIAHKYQIYIIFMMDLLMRGYENFK